MPVFERFTVAIVKASTGTRYPEYKTSSTEARTECYIESTVDENFQIHLEASKLPGYWETKDSLGLHIFVDGKRTDLPIIGFLDGDLVSEVTSIGMSVSSGRYALYKFTARQFSGSSLPQKPYLSV
jgi:hypothetical protein